MKRGALADQHRSPHLAQFLHSKTSNLLSGLAGDALLGNSAVRKVRPDFERLPEFNRQAAKAAKSSWRPMTEECTATRAGIWG